MTKREMEFLLWTVGVDSSGSLDAAIAKMVHSRARHERLRAAARRALDAPGMGADHLIALDALRDELKS